MIKIEETETYGWEAAIRGMRNPLESWEKSDSSFCAIDSIGDCVNPKEYLLCEDCDVRDLTLGPNDHTLMMKLRKAGSDHRKYLRMIAVTCDITAPLYWWKEFDTYKVGTVANSCSTMHKIHSRDLTLDDFSTEHMNRFNLNILWTIIGSINYNRQKYVELRKKDNWWQIIQMLPTSYNQKRTIQMNYEVLANMYKSRKDHKLDEWHFFCDWIEKLPYSELIIGDK